MLRWRNWLMQVTLNHWIFGSTKERSTSFNTPLAQLVEQHTLSESSNAGHQVA